MWPPCDAHFWTPRRGRGGWTIKVAAEWIRDARGQAARGDVASFAAAPMSWTPFGAGVIIMLCG